jgi:hypothetical protein
LSQNVASKEVAHSSFPITSIDASSAAEYEQGMKRSYPLFLLILLATCGMASAQVISPIEAKHYIGEKVRVAGRVEEFRTISGEAFLDMGGRYPKEPFTIYCAPETKISRKTLATFEGKHVEVTGKMESYGKRPEIVLTSLDQISLK